MRYKKFLPFKKARAFAHTLNFKSVKDWEHYCRSGNRPSYIPAIPRVTYKDKGWISWGDWLGTGRVAYSKTQFLSFKQARKLIRSLKLKNTQAWNTYLKSGSKPNNIPSYPYTFYKERGWISMCDWLGVSSSRAKVFKPFKQARAFVRSLGFSSCNQWLDYCKSGNKPEYIPYAPNDTYKNKGWISWVDWLGMDEVFARNRKFMPFKKARAFARSLKFSSKKEWLIYCKSKARPANIPSNPNISYKNKGWVSTSDWLGIEILK